MERYCLMLDLKDDEKLIEEYENYHKKVWPEIIKSIHQSGIHSMEIYRVGNRLCMIVEAEETFSFASKAQADAADAKVQEWEKLMWNYQQALPLAQPGEKWLVGKRIFKMKNGMQIEEEDKIY